VSRCFIQRHKDTPEGLKPKIGEDDGARYGLLVVKFLGQKAFCAPSSRLFFVYLSWFPIEISMCSLKLERLET
jgi:hypothetical protein